jgi:hypothetical protein
MTRTNAVKTTLCGCLAAAAPLLALAAPAPAAPAPPAELSSVEQKMSELQVSSARLAGKIELVGRKLPSKLSALRSLTVSFSGEESTSPPAATVTETTLGKSITVMEVGQALYLRDPAIAKLDGGKPWVQASVSSTGLAGGSLGLGAAGNQSHPFSGEATLLRSATGVRSLGPGTVDGQSVTGFAGSVSPAKLAEGQIPAKLQASLRRLRYKLTGSFEVFVAADGEPVRTVARIGIGPIAMRVSLDVLATDFPVAPVAAPPASETITAAEARTLLAKAKAKKKG